MSYAFGDRVTTAAHITRVVSDSAGVHYRLARAQKGRYTQDAHGYPLNGWPGEPLPWPDAPDRYTAEPAVELTGFGRDDGHVRFRRETYDQPRAGIVAGKVLRHEGTISPGRAYLDDFDPPHFSPARSLTFLELVVPYEIFGPAIMVLVLPDDLTPA